MKQLNYINRITTLFKSIFTFIKDEDYPKVSTFINKEKKR